MNFRSKVCALVVLLSNISDIAQEKAELTQGASNENPQMSSQVRKVSVIDPTSSISSVSSLRLGAPATHDLGHEHPFCTAAVTTFYIRHLSDI